MTKLKMASGAVLAALALVAAGEAGAQAQAPNPTRPAATPPAATPPSTMPAQTTATYGDWVLRCVNPAEAAAGPRSCEVLQTLTIRNQPQPVAQVALGSPAKGEPMRLTVVVPVAISLARAPQVKSGETTLLPLAWRRCLPTGCFADANLSADLLRTLRARTEPLQLAFQDAGNQDVTLPFSPKGLAPALDALAKEDAAR